MVYLVLTESGWYGLLNTDIRDAAIWLSSDALSPAEVERCRSKGFNITIFSHPVDVWDTAQFKADLETIEEHHPDQSIWIEYGRGRIDQSRTLL